VEIPACCPACDEPFVWELDLTVDRELAWAAPDGPAFTFQCAGCQALVQIAFAWRLERGSDPRQLQLVGGATPSRPVPRILLVERCPHGCGLRLGLQLEPDDPWAASRVWPDEPQVLGGYRCPRCDGEGRLAIWPVLSCVEAD
jgi:hypothetical protein